MQGADGQGVDGQGVVSINNRLSGTALASVRELELPPWLVSSSPWEGAE